MPLFFIRLKLNAKKQLICDWGHFLSLFRSHFSGSFSFVRFFPLIFFQYESFSIWSSQKALPAAAAARVAVHRTARTNFKQRQDVQQTRNKVRKRTVSLYLLLFSQSTNEISQCWVSSDASPHYTFACKPSVIHLKDRLDAIVRQKSSTWQRKPKNSMHYDYILLFPFNGTIVKCFKHLYRTHNLFTRRMKKKNDNSNNGPESRKKSSAQTEADSR